MSNIPKVILKALIGAAAAVAEYLIGLIKPKP
jgi:hypothetical protein